MVLKTKVTEDVGIVSPKSRGGGKANSTLITYKDRKELDQYRGQDVKITDPEGNVLVSEEEVEQGIGELSADVIKELGKSTAKALVEALRDFGDEIEKATYKYLGDNSFKINIIFKNNTKKEYLFSVSRGKELSIDDPATNNSTPVSDLGFKPGSDLPIINKDVVKDSLLKYFKTVQESKKTWKEIAIGNYYLEEARSRARYRALIEEAYTELLQEGFLQEARKAVDHKKKLTEAKKLREEKKPDSKEKIRKLFYKFPTLEQAVKKLQSEDFGNFVESIDWVSPRPSMFRVNLKNGQYYLLKWMGKGFQAQISGKKYFLDKLDEYQQAINKLAILYNEGPFTGGMTEGEGMPDDFGKANTSGGSFPGGEGGGGEAPLEPSAGTLDTAGEEGEGGGGSPDLGGEPIEFEEPGESPD